MNILQGMDRAWFGGGVQEARESASSDSVTSQGVVNPKLLGKCGEGSWLDQMDVLIGRGQLPNPIVVNDRLSMSDSSSSSAPKLERLDDGRDVGQRKSSYTHRSQTGGEASLLSFHGGKPYELLTKIREGSSEALAQIVQNCTGTRSLPKSDGMLDLRIGQGGFGSVKLARRDETLFALKSVSPVSGRAELEALELLQQIPSESRGSLVQTLNIATLKGKSREKTYVLQELMIKGSISSKRDCLNFGSRFTASSQRNKLKVALGLIEPVVVLHANGLIHRDLKPDNYMFNGSRIKLGDFGSLTTADHTKGFSGTPEFLAPEVFQRKKAGPEADAFALGVMLYTLATGAHPLETIGSVDWGSKGRAHLDFMVLEDVVNIAIDEYQRGAPLDLKTIGAFLMHPDVHSRCTSALAKTMVSSLLEPSRDRP